jgi:hypothetical protein
MEAFFTTMSAFEKEPTAKEIAKIFEDNDMQIVGPILNVE